MKRSCPTHPKTNALMRALGLSRYAAVGLLELMWHFTASYARRGDIGRHSDETIADALGWTEPPGKLIAGLLTAGFLDEDRDHRLVIHDWWEHADDAVHASVARAREFFVCGKVPRLPKLSAKEKPEVEKFYSENAAEPARRRRANGGRRRTLATSPSLPSLCLSPSEPSIAPGEPARGRETWLTPFLELWRERVRGAFNFGKAGTYLAPLVQEHGQDAVVEAFANYLEQTEARHATFARFAETYGAWSGDAPRASPTLKRGDADELGFLERRGALP